MMEYIHSTKTNTVSYGVLVFNSIVSHALHENVGYIAPCTNPMYMYTYILTSDPSDFTHSEGYYTVCCIQPGRPISMFVRLPNLHTAN